MWDPVHLIPNPLLIPLLRFYLYHSQEVPEPPHSTSSHPYVSSHFIENGSFSSDRTLSLLVICLSLFRPSVHVSRFPRVFSFTDSVWLLWFFPKRVLYCIFDPVCPTHWQTIFSPPLKDPSPWCTRFRVSVLCTFGVINRPTRQVFLQMFYGTKFLHSNGFEEWHRPPRTVPRQGRVAGLG